MDKQSGFTSSQIEYPRCRLVFPKRYGDDQLQPLSVAAHCNRACDWRMPPYEVLQGKLAAHLSLRQ